MTTNNAVLYARVSSGDQAADLDRQMQHLRDYAAAQGLHVVQEVQEIGSGLNGHRKRLMKALENPSASTIVVEHRDRLARFGSEYIESALASSNRRVVIVNDTEMKDDLVQDMIDVLTFVLRPTVRKAGSKEQGEEERCRRLNGDPPLEVPRPETDHRNQSTTRARQVLSYLSDMRDATRMALAYALVDARLNGGRSPRR